MPMTVPEATVQPLGRHIANYSDWFASTRIGVRCCCQWYL